MMGFLKAEWALTVPVSRENLYPLAWEQQQLGLILTLNENSQPEDTASENSIVGSLDRTSFFQFEILKSKD